MTKRTVLQKILNRLDGTNQGTVDAIKKFDEQVKAFRSTLEQEITVSTLGDVNSKIDRLRRSVDLKPLLEGLKTLEKNFKDSVLNITKELESKSKELQSLKQTVVDTNDDQFAELLSEIVHLKTSLSAVERDSNNSLGSFKKSFDELFKSRGELVKSVEQNRSDIGAVKGLREKDTQKTEEELKKIQSKIEASRIEFLSKLSGLPRGGGNANRNIAIGGNSSVLSRYTDINIKAGNNVTITYSNNDVTKYLDVTIAATGGGGGGSVTGIIRSINTVNTSQTMDNVAGTDYVYLATAGIKLTLPAATGNTNLYTVKNISNSSILVSGTVDDDVNGIIMPIKYTSVDLISNDTDWKIT